MRTRSPATARRRDKEGATSREMRAAFAALFRAAGLTTAPPQPRPAAEQQQQQQQQQQPAEPEADPGPGDAVPGAPGWRFGPDPPPAARAATAAALREVAKSLQAGRGAEPDAALATELFRRAAALGDAEAHGQMGLRYAVGLARRGAVEGGSAIRAFDAPDEARALLHYYFGAAGGDLLSRLALGYRHAHGAGVPKSCWAAAAYYQPAAEAVVDEALARGGLPHVERARLSASGASAGLASERSREVLQYFQHAADRGDAGAQSTVGRVLHAGSHGVARDARAALHYLARAAAAGDVDAMAHLGHMHASGAADSGGGGGAPDYAKAFSWFSQAAAPPRKSGQRRLSASAHYGLGHLYLHGLGVPSPDAARALKHFQAAADLGDRNAHFALGSLYLRGAAGAKRSPSKAYRHTSIAAQGGHLQAAYQLALMHLAGEAASRDCPRALSLLKGVAERGALAGGALQGGHEAFFRGRYTEALLRYLAASEMGLELAQSNAAWMLERGYGHAGWNAAAVGVSLLRRSAEQGNVQSLLLLGDAHYHGAGAPRDWRRAAAIYYEAYRERSAEAMFNLGLLHELGAGVPRDLALADRFFAMARHTLPDAALPVAAARAWLRAHAALEWLAPRLPAALRALVPEWLLTGVVQPPPTAQTAAAAAAATAGAAGQPGSGGSGSADGSAAAAAGSSGSTGGGFAAGLMPPRLSMHLKSLAGRLIAAWAGFARLGAGGGRGGGAAGDYYFSGGDGVDGGSGADGGGGPGGFAGGGGGGGDAGETALLAALLVVLAIVLRVRRQRQLALEARVRAELAAGGAGGEAALLAERMGVEVPPAEPPLRDPFAADDGGDADAADAATDVAAAELPASQVGGSGGGSGGNRGAAAAAAEAAAAARPTQRPGSSSGGSGGGSGGGGSANGSGGGGGSADPGGEIQPADDSADEDAAAPFEGTAGGSGGGGGDGGGGGSLRHRRPIARDSSDS